MFSSCLFGFRGFSLLKLLLLLGNLGPVGTPVGMCVTFCPVFVLARQKLGVRRLAESISWRVPVTLLVFAAVGAVGDAMLSPGPSNLGLAESLSNPSRRRWWLLLRLLSCSAISRLLLPPCLLCSHGFHFIFI